MSRFFGRLKKSNNDVPVVEQKVSVWEDRIYWINILRKIVRPVLENLSKDSLKRNMIVEYKSPEMLDSSYFEAFACVFNGISPWLELDYDGSEESVLRENFVSFTIKAISNAVNPKKNDYILHTNSKQSLLSISLFAQGLLRSKNKIWNNLPMEVQSKIIDELKNSRNIAPYENHWILFTSMVEAALLEFTGECDKERLRYAVHKFRDEWYMGDGIYTDGDQYTTTYHNSIFIHPMLNDILAVMRKYRLYEGEFLDIQLMRSSRLSSQLERCISPDGSFPIIGNSICYRTGIFHVLSQAALFKILPNNVNPSQVRAALTKVIKNLFEGDQNFNENGWLLMGFNGHQPKMAEHNFSTGSLYLCCAVFLPLGLDQNDSFWIEESKPWTSLKAWKGDLPEKDQSIDF